MLQSLLVVWLEAPTWKIMRPVFATPFRCHRSDTN